MAFCLNLLPSNLILNPPLGLWNEPLDLIYIHCVFHKQSIVGHKAIETDRVEIYLPLTL